MSHVLNVLLAHLPEREIQPYLECWRPVCPPDHLLLAFGGPPERLEGISHRPAILIEDPQLRTRDHQRERQSYTTIFHQTAEWLRLNDAERHFDHIHLIEYDQLPLTADFNARQVAQLQAEGADALTFGLRRLDGTGHPHYLYHAHDPGFHEFFAGISRREEKEVVLSMFGSGSFWTREAFEAVAAVEEPFPVYLEIWLPTLAHHLGCRVRNFQGEAACGYIRNLGDYGGQIEAARTRGAWSIHPVKHLPVRDGSQLVKSSSDLPFPT